MARVICPYGCANSRGLPLSYSRNNNGLPNIAYLKHLEKKCLPRQLWIQNRHNEPHEKSGICPYCGEYDEAFESHFQLCTKPSKFTNDFEEIRELAEGAFGNVFEAKNKVDHRRYAIKRICLSQGLVAKAEVEREMCALSNLEHSGIVRYYQSWFEIPPNDGHDDTRTDDQSTSNRTELNTEESAAEGEDTTTNVSSDLSVPPTSSTVDFLLSPMNQLSIQTDAGDQHLILDDDASSMAERKPQGRSRRAFFYIQMELCKTDTLREYIDGNSQIENNYTERLKIFYKIANAVKYIHEKGLIHRDLKPSNILFSQSGEVKVGDFGLVTSSISNGDSESSSSSQSQVGSGSSRNHTRNVGTQNYMSPEQVMELSYDKKVDIYALGVVFVELMSRFGTTSERADIIRHAKSESLHLQPHFSSAQFEFVKRLLERNPQNRPDIEVVLQDEIFYAVNPAAQARESLCARAARLLLVTFSSLFCAHKCLSHHRRMPSSRSIAGKRETLCRNR